MNSAIMAHIDRLNSQQLADAVFVRLSYVPQYPVGSAEFNAWCKANGVPCRPASPTTVAAFVLDSHDQQTPYDLIIDRLETIAQNHGHAFGNPVASNIVAAALLEIAPHEIKPPSAWRKDERLAFILLPLDVQRAVNRREKDRERYFTWKMQKMNSAVANVAPDRASGSENKNNSGPHSEPAHVNQEDDNGTKAQQDAQRAA
jgi:hypothetical protein